MPCINQPPFKAIHKLPIRADILQDDVVIWTKKLINDNFYQWFYHYVDLLFADYVLKNEA